MPVRRSKWLAISVLLSMFMVLAMATTALASEGGVPAFPDLYKIGWTAVNFFILLAILYKFAFNPIRNMLEERANTIESSLNYASGLRDEVEQLRKEAAANLAESRKEAQDIVAKANKVAEDNKNEILAKAQAEANAEREKAIAQIKAEKESAVAEIRDTAATLAIMAAEKVLGRAITDEDHKALVKDFIKESGDRLC
ncbi:MAG: F0F1 ATP synthase subunit B [Solirubrobacterales bacterium]